MAVGARGKAHSCGANRRRVGLSRRDASLAKPGHLARLRAFPVWQPLAWLAIFLLSGSRLSAAPLVGGYVDLTSLSPKAQAAELSRLVGAGAGGVRLPLDWNRVEPKSNRFSWKADDAAVNAARAKKLDVTLVLGPNAVWAVNPAWKVPLKDRAYSIPKSLSLWERYVRQAAMHFKGRVRYWQVREQPNIRNFRGARSEYLRLVTSAARVLRKVDPAAVLIVPEGGALDVAEIDRLCGSNLRAACNVLGVYLPASHDVSASALAWSVLSKEVPGVGTAARRPVWVLGADGVLPAESWAQQYLLAWAFGASRVYLPAPAVDQAWLAPLSQLRYLGFLKLGPEVWAFAFEDETGPVVAAWSSGTAEIPAADLAPVLEAAALKQSCLLGGDPGAAGLDGNGTRLRLGPRPILVRGLDAAKAEHPGAPGRADLLASRPGPDLDPSSPVYVDYSRPESPEYGLYNRGLRSRVGGRVEEETHNGRLCLRTRIGSDPQDDESDSPWVYFDVDDRWLYFGRGKTPVAITVECDGSYLGEEKLGFNVMYDSITGYRFTRWQWVEPGSGWKSYRVELPDVSFADRNGYDFRINIKGSKQDIWISSVKVERIPSPTALGKAKR